MRRCKPISDIDVFQYAFSRKMGLRLASERPVASRDDLHEKCGLGMVDHASGHRPSEDAMRLAYRWLGEQIGLGPKRWEF